MATVGSIHGLKSEDTLIFRECAETEEEAYKKVAETLNEGWFVEALSEDRPMKINRPNFSID